MKQKYTIQDVALLAGVGTTTVTRVLNDRSYVSETTRQKVLDAIDELGYRPNFSARQMRTHTSRTVGFLSQEVITRPGAVHVIQGAQQALSSQGKMMLVVDVGSDKMETRAAIETLLERQVEGIIYAASSHRSVDLPANLRRIPTVLANCYALDRSLPSVVPDEEQGGYDATILLLEKGHRRVGFINLGPRRTDGRKPVASKGRLRGYRKALAEYGIDFDENLLKYSDRSVQTNYQLVQEMMQERNPPTAIFCGKDRIALGCYGALKDLGIRIPHDVAVIGFDNHIELAEYLWPPLTTMQLPHYEMGKWAVSYLLDSKNEGGSPSPVQHKLVCPLIERSSV